MRIACLSIATLMLSGCAYVGDPLPPALKVPTPVTDLAAHQVGSELLVSYTVPDLTMEGLKMPEVGNVELRVGPAGAPFSADTWAGNARAIEVPSKAAGKADVKVGVAPFAGQDVVVGVRLANAKGRLSPWSNFVTLRVLAPLAKPSGVRAVATAAGVALEWENPAPSPARQWKVFRQSTGDAEPVEMATAPQPRFVDIGAAYDVAHRYTLIAVEGDAVSERSEPVSITPEDKFAPATPQGLSALAGPAAAQLSWERNQEPDLLLYRIYRSSGNEPAVRIAESTSAANYRDTSVTAGRGYRYSISAVDRKGNESAKSDPVEIVIP